MMKPYLADLRDRAITGRYYDLLMSSFDPLDRNQRELLEKYVPGYTESKIDVYRACNEQKEFIQRCAVVPSIAPAEHQRIVRILGGAEKILIHPMDKAIAASTLGSAKLGILGDIKKLGASKNDGALPGLFSFLTSPKDDRSGVAEPQKAELEKTEGLRLVYAELVLKHFPRYLQGAFSPFDDTTVSRKKTEAAAAELVKLCEAIVSEMQPLGDVANDMLRLMPAGQRAQRVSGPQVASQFSVPRSNNPRRFQTGY
jgi:hypothetical protein